MASKENPDLDEALMKALKRKESGLGTEKNSSREYDMAPAVQAKVRSFVTRARLRWSLDTTMWAWTCLRGRTRGPACSRAW